MSKPFPYKGDFELELVANLPQEISSINDTLQFKTAKIGADGDILKSSTPLLPEEETFPSA